MKHLTLVFLVLILVGCKSTTYRGYDTEFNREGIPMSVTTNAFSSEQEMREAIKHIKQEDVVHIHKGLAIYYLNSYECILYVVRPSKFNGRGDYATTIGHEYMHCLYGDYHN